MLQPGPQQAAEVVFELLQEVLLWAGQRHQHPSSLTGMATHSPRHQEVKSGDKRPPAPVTVEPLVTGVRTFCSFCSIPL